jgi:hypothetical protein
VRLRSLERRVEDGTWEGMGEEGMGKEKEMGDEGREEVVGEGQGDDDEMMTEAEVEDEEEEEGEEEEDWDTMPETPPRGPRKRRSSQISTDADSLPTIKRKRAVEYDAPSSSSAGGRVHSPPSDEEQDSSLENAIPILPLVAAGEDTPRSLPSPAY